MCAPLYDDRGTIRYFIGAQIDVTGLISEGMGIESFRSLLQKPEQETDRRSYDTTQSKRVKDTLDRLQELTQMFSHDEMEVVSKMGRSDDSTDTSSIRSGVPTSVKYRNRAKRIIGADEMLGEGLNLSQVNLSTSQHHSLPGAYQHYLLVRPAPSLQITFVSPSLRIPGLLRTHLFSKLGGPAATISALQDAFRDGAAVTAKVLWLPKNAQSGERRAGQEVRPRWIRCTPLLGSDDRVGVWMIILVPIEEKVRFGRRDVHVGGMVDEFAVERMRLARILEKLRVYE
ncbi:hypothetical protein M7I_5240 [Glarea lozoyensis 74030]|uniref:PAC domain-containing protein n=1 Tax=Glarea lozoyensis (strain ATCC 74030 / MF5533) TaxID=1104152 RepID=H0ERC1_GLAL7|nr:hypothetical protein M7I_5240 [Glarea lozoyensis 74030]